MLVDDEVGIDDNCLLEDCQTDDTSLEQTQSPDKLVSQTDNQQMQMQMI